MIGVISIILTILFFCLSISPVSAKFYSSSVIPDTNQNYGTPRDLITLPSGEMWYVDSQNSRVVNVSVEGEILRVVGRAGSGEGEFGSVLTSITRDNNGYLYVLDFCRIYKLDFNGGFMESFAGCGEGEGQFSEPRAIHYDAYSDSLLVSDTVHNRVLKFNTSGDYLESFGSGGGGNGQFSGPNGLTTDSLGNIYVVDAGNHRVQVLDGSGVFLRSFGSNVEANDDYLVFPKDVVVLSNGDVVVSSQNSQRIKKFSASGEYITQWGEGGVADYQFVYPEYLTRAADDSVWVTDWDQRRIQKFSDEGVFLSVIGNSDDASGKFTNPFSLSFDTLGNIYVLDDTRRVQKFDEDGVYLTTSVASGLIGGGAYHMVITPDNQYIVVSESTSVAVYNQSGELVNYLGNQGVNGPSSGPGDFDGARGMAFDSGGFLYVTDMINGRVQKFDLSHLTDLDFFTTYNGGFVSQWPAMARVEQIFIDGDDNVYLSASEWQEDSSLDVRIYNTSGVMQSTFINGFGEGSGQYYKISGLFFNSTYDRFYLSDDYYNRIQVYNQSGEFVETIGSSGGGVDQFSGVKYARINPLTGDLVAADTFNHRIHLFRDGVKIHNLIDSADVIENVDNISLANNTVDPSELESVDFEASLFFGSYIVSDFVVNMSADRDWQSVNAIVLPSESKSLVVNLNTAEAQGISDTHSLYVVKKAGQKSVRVCSEADEIAEVELECEGYTLAEGDSTLSSVTVGGVNYWKIEGLTGTGAVGIDGEEVVDDSSDGSTPGETNNGQQNSVCQSQSPGSNAELFRIDRIGSSAKLWIRPVSNPYNGYIVWFGDDSSIDDYSDVFDSSNSTGMIVHTINHLNPQRTYSFAVQAKNGCAVSGLSNKVISRSSSGSTHVNSVSSRKNNDSSGTNNIVNNNKPDLQIEQPVLQNELLVEPEQKENLVVSEASLQKSIPKTSWIRNLIKRFFGK